MEKLKKCSKCGRELPVSEFWKNASTEDGLQTYCNRRIESTWIYRRIEIHPNNIIINGKVTSIGYNQISEQMSYVLQQLMGFFKITSC